MNILFVQETDWIKKGPLQQHHLAERLQKRGHVVRVIDFEVLWKENRGIHSGRKIFHVSRTIQDTKVTVIRPAFLRLPLLVYLSVLVSHSNELLRQMKEFQPDVVVGFDVPNSYMAFKLAKRLKIPSIYYVIDVNYLFVPEKFLHPLAKATELKSVRCSDAVIAINDVLKAFYVRNMGADPQRTHVIGAGIDEQSFNPSINGSEVRKKYGIEKEDVVLFFMGWVYDFSGLKEIASLLPRHVRGTKIKLLIVGKGSLYGELLSLKTNKLGDRLILVDWQPYEKIPELIAASDICLLPAYNNEIMRNIVPIKMYEYMACGKPVIATRLPGIMKEFGEGNGVLYVDGPKDVLPLAHRLAKDRKTMTEAGARAAEYVKRFSWETITDQFEAILKNLATRDPRCKEIAAHEQVCL